MILEIKFPGKNLQVGVVFIGIEDTANGITHTVNKHSSNEQQQNGPQYQGCLLCGHQILHQQRTGDAQTPLQGYQGGHDLRCCPCSNQAE
ncbi:hypothetical protein ACOMHN_018221 [Nucella lapillus]